MANKTFLTYDEQIKKLEKEKQLVISDPKFAKITLQKLSYFSLIDGYKDLYKHKPSGNYLHGVTFEEIAALKRAFLLWKEYASLSTVAQHDTLQQTVNLANMMIQAGEYRNAANLIEFCETIILDYSDIKSFDYGICQFLRGIMAYRQGKPVILAEKSLLEAENILSAYTEDNGYYLKNVSDE